MALVGLQSLVLVAAEAFVAFDVGVDELKSKVMRMDQQHARLMSHLVITESGTREEFFAADRANDYFVLIEVSSLVNPQRVCAFELEMTNVAFEVSFLDVLVHVPFEIAFRDATFSTKLTSVQRNLFVDSSNVNLQAV